MTTLELFVRHDALSWMGWGAVTLWFVAIVGVAYLKVYLNRRRGTPL